VYQDSKTIWQIGFLNAGFDMCPLITKVKVEALAPEKTQFPSWTRKWLRKGKLNEAIEKRCWNPKRWSKSCPNRWVQLWKLEFSWNIAPRQKSLDLLPYMFQKLWCMDFKISSIKVQFLKQLYFFLGRMVWSVHISTFSQNKNLPFLTKCNDE